MCFGCYTGSFFSGATVAAVVPKSEKVEREIIVKAPVEKTWAALTAFGAINQWHPSVTEAAVETKKDESIRKYEYKLVEGLPVEGYRAIFKVKPGANENESKITYKARFYADPKGVKAVEAFYDAGLPGLKALIEAN